MRCVSESGKGVLSDCQSISPSEPVSLAVGQVGVVDFMLSCCVARVCCLFRDPVLAVGMVGPRVDSVVVLSAVSVGALPSRAGSAVASPNPYLCSFAMWFSRHGFPSGLMTLQTWDFPQLALHLPHWKATQMALPFLGLTSVNFFGPVVCFVAVLF